MACRLLRSSALLSPFGDGDPTMKIRRHAENREARAAAAPPKIENSAVAEQRDSGFPDHESIEALAYRYWQQRGCPIGDPEVDWLRAEQDLSAQRSDRAPERRPGQYLVAGS